MVLRRPPLTRGQQFLVIPTALGDLELKRRKMNGLIAEFDTIVIPMIACDPCMCVKFLSTLLGANLKASVLTASNFGDGTAAKLELKRRNFKSL